MWAVRDAVLLRLYRAATNGELVQTLTPEDVAGVVDWRAEPITQQEILDASDYLRKKDLVTGHGTWGGELLRPKVTVAGEDLAAAGISVRPTRGEPLPANPSGGDTYNITATGNVAVHGQNFSQTYNQGDSGDAIAQVIGALRLFAEKYEEQAEATRLLADQLEEEVASGQSNPSKLVTLLTSVTGALGTAFGSEMGQQVSQASFAAIQAVAGA